MKTTIVIKNPEMWGYAGEIDENPYWVIKSFVWDSDNCTNVVSVKAQFFLGEIERIIHMMSPDSSTVNVTGKEFDLVVINFDHSETAKSIHDQLYHDLRVLASGGKFYSQKRYSALIPYLNN